MALKIPSFDGEINKYDLSQSNVAVPRIYYVNGIRVLGRDHAVTAALLSLLTERPIWGVYNRTAGSVSGLIFDVGQSALDYLQNASARFGSRGLTPDKNFPDHEIPKLVNDVISRSTVWNKATAALFKSVMLNRNSSQMIIAHSQGNLVTSNALFIVERILGSSALRKVRVYSLASPSPGWPLGLSVTNGGGGRQENAFMNDLVALLRPHNLAAKLGVKRFQNEGDFRTHKDSGPVSLGPHDTGLNIALNFLQSIRKDLGLSPNPSADFLAAANQKAQAAIPKDERGWLQKLDDLF